VTVNYDGVSYRPTLETVNVFTSAGEQTITNLTDVYSPYTDGPQTITLSSAVNTTYVYVQPTAYYTHGDPNIGISEVGVNSTTNLVIPRPNLALNAAVSASASWTTTANGANPAGVVTSGNLMQHSDTADSTAYTLQMAGIQAGNYIQLNLGVPTLTGTIGVDQGTEYDSDGDPRREMLAGFTLQFSNDPNFGTLVSSQDLSVADNLAYEQLDYSPVLAQYVRLIADSQDAEAPTTGNYASDPTNVIAIQQIQLFAPTPEPASIALLAFGGIGLLARRRPVRLPQSVRQIVH
jgi:hypothetical protein